jgi:hypothetical protein
MIFPIVVPAIQQETLREIHRDVQRVIAHAQHESPLEHELAWGVIMRLEMVLPAILGMSREEDRRVFHDVEAEEGFSP